MLGTVQRARKAVMNKTGKCLHFPGAYSEIYIKQSILLFFYLFDYHKMEPVGNLEPLFLNHVKVYK